MKIRMLVDLELPAWADTFRPDPRETVEWARMNVADLCGRFGEDVHCSVEVIPPARESKFADGACFWCGSAWDRNIWNVDACAACRSVYRALNLPPYGSFADKATAEKMHAEIAATSGILTAEQCGKSARGPVARFFDWGPIRPLHVVFVACTLIFCIGAILDWWK